MSLLLRLFPYNKQWCVVLAFITALSWSFMDLYTGFTREIVDSATIIFVAGAAICTLAVPAFFFFRHEFKVSVSLAPQNIQLPYANVTGANIIFVTGAAICTLHWLCQPSTFLDMRSSCDVTPFWALAKMLALGAPCGKSGKYSSTPLI